MALATTTGPHWQLKQLLLNQGPLLSGDLAREMVSAGISRTESSARKIIERSRKRGHIRSTAPVTFQKSYLCFLPEHEQKRYPAAVKKLLKLRPPFHRVFATTLANCGYITFGQIAKSAVCSDGTQNGRLTPERTIEQLLHLDVLESVVGQAHLYRIGTRFGAPTTRRRTFETRLKTEEALIQLVLEWLQHCYLLPPEARTVRSTAFLASKFNQNWWDICGPAYLGLAESSALNNTSHRTFLVADFISYRQVTKSDTSSFTERVRDIRSRWKALQFVPVFIGNGFSKDAWAMLRSTGIAAVPISDVFGAHLTTLLQRFEDALSVRTGDEISLKKITGALEMSEQPGITDGLVGNLRGAIFELIVALYYRNQGYDVTLQKLVRYPGAPPSEMEIDIVAVKSDKIAILVECKGRTKGVSEDSKEISRHFNERLTAACDSFGWDITRRYNRIDAVFISLGVVSSADRPIQPEAGLRDPGINRQVIDRNEFLDMLKDARENDLRQLIERFF